MARLTALVLLLAAAVATAFVAPRASLASRGGVELSMKADKPSLKPLRALAAAPALVATQVMAAEGTGKAFGVDESTGVIVPIACGRRRLGLRPPPARTTMQLSPRSITIFIAFGVLYSQAYTDNEPGNADFFDEYQRER